MARADPAPAATASSAGWPTGIRMFLILVVALLPLGLIAMVATLQSTRTADVERRALLRIAATESARTLSVEIVGDMAALRTAANALAADPGDRDTCARVSSILAVQTAGRIRFGIGRVGERAFCGYRLPPLFAPGTVRASPVAGRILGDRGLLLGVRSDDGTTSARAYFPTELLAELGRPSNFLPGYGLAITHEGKTLDLHASTDDRLIKQVDRLAVPIGFDTLGVEMSLSRLPMSAAEIVALVAPVLMWITAALIAWLITDRLLLGPLRRLRGGLIAYTPGQKFAAPETDGVAIELRDLGDTFVRITQVVAAHEADLAQGLDRQTRLTREVHHRVKNNLQVIASLINLHARGAKGREAVRAYASIQRRVDAMSVVHRNHFAEMEVNRGLPLRSVIAELASNIRATAPDSAGRMQIALELEPVYVTQDTALAVAFLVTELVELAMRIAEVPVILIAIRNTPEPGRAILCVESPVLADSSKLRRQTEGSVARVMQGLARQLRSTLAHDTEMGRYCIEIGYVARD